MGSVTVSNLDDVFSYHKPKGDFQIEKYHRIRTAAKLCAQTILDVDDSLEVRAGAIAAFEQVIKSEVGDCSDKSEALAMTAAAEFLVREISDRTGPPDPVAAAMFTQDIIRCVRAAVMWTNAAVALEGRI